MRIAYCIPCHGSPKFAFTTDFGNLVLASKDLLLDTEFDILGAEGSDLPLNRNTLAEEALRRGADYLLWLDADHRFPSDALARLIRHSIPLVAANYVNRSHPEEIMPAAARVNGERLYPRAEGGLEEAGTAGLGLCLMSAQVLAAVRKPWFVGGTEDVFFFKRARAAGFPLMIDHDLDIAHIAETELRFPR